jgi:hypothetical protein
MAEETRSSLICLECLLEAHRFFGRWAFFVVGHLYKILFMMIRQPAGAPVE